MLPSTYDFLRIYPHHLDDWLRLGSENVSLIENHLLPEVLKVAFRQILSLNIVSHDVLLEVFAIWINVVRDVEGLEIVLLVVLVIIITDSQLAVGS